MHSQVGDRVVALPEFRAWAELCAVPTKYVYKLPDEISFQDAAAITMNYLVAYIIVFELLSLRSGKSLMLHSAGGGVVSIQFIFFYLTFIRSRKHKHCALMQASHLDLLTFSCRYACSGGGGSGRSNKSKVFSDSILKVLESELRFVVLSWKCILFCNPHDKFNVRCEKLNQFHTKTQNSLVHKSLCVPSRT